MPTINASLGPGFTITVGQGANLVLAATIYDRAGNVIDLTGFAVKLAAKRTVRKSNGLGQLTNQQVTLFDVVATIVTAVQGNISVALTPAYTASPGVYVASLRLFNDGVTGRNPDDSYTGTFIVDESVVPLET